MEYITQEQLDSMVKNHIEWFSSRGEKGKKLILQNVDLSYMQLSTFDFSDQCLKGAVFNNCIFDHCTCYRVWFNNAQFENCVFRNSNFEWADFDDAVFNSCMFDNLKTKRASIQRAAFNNCKGESIFLPLK